MDPKVRIQELLKLQNSILDKAKTEKRCITDEEDTLFKTYQKEIENCQKTIQAQQLMDATNAALNIPVVNAAVTEPRVELKDPSKFPKVFKSFSEQMMSVKNAAHGKVDPRLGVLNAALGLNEGVGADGGFAVQTDFIDKILESAVKDDPVLSRVDSYGVSQKANGVGWNELNETDLSTTVWGGVRAYWASEAATVTATKLQIQAKELKLEKLMAIVYDTFERDEDSNWGDVMITKACTDALRRELANAIITGDGIGKCIGLTKAGSLVTQAKETNQVAATINWENLSKMYHRALNRSSGKYVWLMHPDCHQQLDFLKVVIGTGGVPVYLPAAQSGTVDMLRGLPIIESDHCSALGTVGDIIFTDLSQYLMVFKNGINKAVSVHVQFLTAENCYRFIYRVNGMPKRSQTLTLKNTTTTRSSIIALATRS
jgi:HK97 family phage major capsid protein